MDLALTLQRLYDSEINVTITWLWHGGIDFVLTSYMEWEEIGRPIDHVDVIASATPIVQAIGPDPWHHVDKIDELAQALHTLAIEKCPWSEYARTYGRPN